MGYSHGIEVGDKVEILIGGGDTAKYGMTKAMRQAKGVIATVKNVTSDGESIGVDHPYLSFVAYHPSELKKVNPKKEPEFSVGQRVKIVTGGRFGDNETMRRAYGGYGEVTNIHTGGLTPQIRVKSEDGHGTWSYAKNELEHAPAVKLRGFKADTVIVDDPAVDHIQSHDELVAENESLEKQIRKLEARVERKKEFQRQNVRKIAAWDIILRE